MKLTPENIVTRHKESPQDTKILIGEFGYCEYMAAVRDLRSLAEVVRHPETGAAILVLREIDLTHWWAGKMSKYKPY